MLQFIKNLFSGSTGKFEKDLPDLEPADLLRDLQPQIDALAVDSIGIRLNTDTRPKIENSKFGGMPFFPKNEPFPTDGKGKPMRLLAQINFSELPGLSPFPPKGLLQFYVSEFDDLWGFDFDNRTNQKNWKVLYFENLDFESIEKPESFFAGEWKNSPFNGAPFLLEFEKRKDYPSSPCFEYENLILPLFREIEEGDYEDFLEDLYLDKELGLGSKVGGFPHFTQSEFRQETGQFEDYQLLLQIDSQYKEIMWGDMGVAGFFIRPEDLKKRDFSKVAFNWDCH